MASAPLTLWDGELLTEAWLSSKLGAPVSSFSVEKGSPIASLGNLVRLRLEPAALSPVPPRSVILKMESANAGANAFAASQGLFEREVEFYTKLAPAIADVVRVPHCYYASVSPDGTGVVCLLEDLAPAASGDTHAPMTLAQTEAAVRTLARFHGALTNSHVLASLDTTRVPTSPRYAEPLSPAKESFLPAFLELWADRLDEGGVAECAIRACCEDVSAWQAALGAGEGQSVSVVHGDAKSTNMLFFEGSDVAALIDFESYSIGSIQGCMLDLRYLLVGSTDPDVRREHEDAWHELYVEEYNAARRSGDDAVPRLTQELIRPLYVRATQGLVLGALMFSSMMSRMAPPDAVKRQLGTLVTRVLRAAVDDDIRAFLAAL